MVNYQIIRPLTELPPPERKVLDIGDYDFINQLQGLVTEILIKNSDSADATIIINDNASFTLGVDQVHEEGNIEIENIEISGITDGYIIVHYYKLSTLKRFRAIENGA